MKVVLELEWELEIPDDSPDIKAAIAQAMDQYADKRFRFVICDMRYMGEHRIEPWQTQPWKPE